MIETLANSIKSFNIQLVEIRDKTERQDKIFDDRNLFAVKR